MRSYIARVVIAAAALFASTTIVSAQESKVQAHPWAAFLGCWSAEGAVDGGFTCIVPTAESPLAVEQMHVVGNVIVRRAMLTADGTPKEVTDGSCTGVETATISEDAARVYLSGRVRCADAPEQRTSGLLSIAPDGRLLQVISLTADEEKRVSLQRLTSLTWDELPPVVRPALDGHGLSSRGARVAASQALSIAMILDVQRVVDPAAVERWMVETDLAQPGFRATRADLQQLVAAKSDDRIIDRTVMLANPQQFVTERLRANRATSGILAGQIAMRCDAVFSAGHFFGVNQSVHGMNFWMLPTVMFSSFGWMGSCPGYGIYRRWAFNPYGYGYYFDPVLNPGDQPLPGPIGPVPNRGSGTVTKQAGYTSDGAGSTRVAQPRSAPAATSAGSASSSGGGSELRSSSGGTSTGRTAKPRNP